MRSFFFTCLLLSSTAHTDVIAPALPAPNGEPLACITPQPLEQICPCLIREAGLGNECNLVGAQEVRGARLVRAGGVQQTAVYLIADGPGGWRVVHMVAWEQHHGKRESNMHPSAQTELQLGSVRVYRLDYQYQEDISYVDDRLSTVKQTLALLCPREGAANVPRCTVEVQLRCDDREEKGKTTTHKRGTAQLTIAPEGNVTLTRKTPTSGSTCLEKLGTHRIW